MANEVDTYMHKYIWAVCERFEQINKSIVKKQKKNKTKIDWSIDQ